jgi:hypothetical protein
MCPQTLTVNPAFDYPLSDQLNLLGVKVLTALMRLREASSPEGERIGGALVELEAVFGDLCALSPDVEDRAVRLYTRTSLSACDEALARAAERLAIARKGAALGGRVRSQRSEALAFLCGVEEDLRALLRGGIRVL